MTWDLVVRGGRVVDGHTGQPAEGRVCAQRKHGFGRAKGERWWRRNRLA